MDTTKTLRVVIFRDGDGWAAQCLEHDICAHAESLRELLRRFAATFSIECQISAERHGEALEKIPPAPEAFEAMWDKCSGKYEPSSNPKLLNRNIDFALCA